MTAGKTVQGFAIVKTEHTFYFNCAFSSKGKFDSTIKILIENQKATTSAFYSTFTEKEDMLGYFNGAAGFVVDTFVFSFNLLRLLRQSLKQKTRGVKKRLK